MQNKIEGILKDLVHIDNIALDVNGKRQSELVDMEEKYMAEMEELDRQLDDQKASAKKYLEQAAAKAEEEAKAILKNNQADIKALENKFGQVKKEILNQAIHKLFDMEMD